MYTADEVFLTGTATEVTPVAEIDSRLIGDGKGGIITNQLKKLFEYVVRGKDKKFSKKWLTLI